MNRSLGCGRIGRLVACAALVLIVSACSSAVGGETATTAASLGSWGTLTGKLNASWPLGGGQMTVHSAEVQLENGRLVDASIQTGLTDSLGKDWRVRVVETPGSEFEWRIVEIDPATVAAVTTSEVTTTTVPGPPCYGLVEVGTLPEWIGGGLEFGELYEGSSGNTIDLRGKVGCEIDGGVLAVTESGAFFEAYMDECFDIEAGDIPIGELRPPGDQLWMCTQPTGDDGQILMVPKFPETEGTAMSAVERTLSDAELANEGEHRYLVEAFENGCNLSTDGETVITVTFGEDTVTLDFEGSSSTPLTWERSDSTDSYDRRTGLARDISSIHFSTDGLILEHYLAGPIVIGEPMIDELCGHFVYTFAD